MSIEGRQHPKEILKKPYHQVVVADEDGSFSAEISEFPGCIAVGATAAEALASLEEVAEAWLEAALLNNQDIPEPEVEPEYSGKTVLRLPRSLHRQSALMSKREGISLNQLIVTALASYVSANGTSPSARYAPTYKLITLVPSQINNITVFNYDMLHYQRSDARNFSGLWTSLSEGAGTLGRITHG